MSEEQPKGLLWHRIKLLTLIIVFLSPFIGGWMALYVFDLKPASGNYGALVTPVQRLQWPEIVALDGVTHTGGFGRKWTLLMFAGDDCGELCRSNLFYMRQLRTLLGRDTLRLQNVLITARPLSEEMRIYLMGFPNLKVVQGDRNPDLYRQFDLPGEAEVGSAPKLYLVDPDQNLMMHYPAEIDPDLMLQDVKKLLKISQIG